MKKIIKLSILLSLVIGSLFIGCATTKKAANYSPFYIPNGIEIKENSVLGDFVIAYNELYEIMHNTENSFTKEQVEAYLKFEKDCNLLTDMLYSDYPIERTAVYMQSLTLQANALIELSKYN